MDLWFKWYDVQEDIYPWKKDVREMSMVFSSLLHKMGPWIFRGLVRPLVGLLAYKAGYAGRPPSY